MVKTCSESLELASDMQYADQTMHILLTALFFALALTYWSVVVSDILVPVF
jgi:cytochrome c oxidase assembly factor CtaG